IPKAVESRGRFLERIEGGAAETSVDERLVALTAPMSAAAEQYRMLLHRLRHIRSLRGEAIQGGAVVAVTSAIRGEGVSLTAANLALTAARSRDARVALVDCDLRRGGLAQLFDMGGRAGLADVLTGKTEVGEALGRYHEGHLAGRWPPRCARCKARPSGAWCSTASSRPAFPPPCLWSRVNSRVASKGAFSPCRSSRGTGIADAPPAWCSSRRRWWAWRSPSADTTRAAGASSPPWSGLRVACRRRSTSPTSMTRR